MTTSNKNLEVFEQDQANCEEAPEDISDVEMMQGRMDWER